MPRPIKNIKGKRFGNLRAVERVLRPGDPMLPKKSKPKFALWRCVCSCGQVCIKRGDQLRQGLVKSCNVDGHRWRGVDSRHPADRYVRELTRELQRKISGEKA